MERPASSARCALPEMSVRAGTVVARVGTVVSEAKQR